MHWIGAIHWINIIGGANGTPWWWCFWEELFWCSADFLYYSYCRKRMGQEFFIPAQTLIGVKLLSCHGLLMCMLVSLGYPAYIHTRSKKLMGRECFIPAQTLIGVKLLSCHGPLMCMLGANKLLTCFVSTLATSGFGPCHGMWLKDIQKPSASMPSPHHVLSA